MVRKLYVFLTAVILFILPLKAQQGYLISTSADQKQLLKAYRLVLEKSSGDYHDASMPFDNLLFPAFGEDAVYWITSGINKGMFVYPGSLPDDYARLNGNEYNNYNPESQNQVSIQFKKHPKRIAIFKSKFRSSDVTLSWESLYFERLLGEYLMDDMYYTVNEDSLITKGLDENTQLLIIPAFISKEQNALFYVDSIFSVTPGLNTSLANYIAAGGHIYTEGNGVRFLEKCGIIENNAIQYSAGDETGTVTVTEAGQSGVLNLGISSSGGKLYGNRFPAVNSARIVSIATTPAGKPCLFTLQPAYTSGSKIICNTGLPTVNGLSENPAGGLQINWTMSCILDAFSYDLDVTRKVHNELLANISAGDNSVSYDKADTIEVRIKIRNLSDQPISGIAITEEMKPYFAFVGVSTADAYSLSGHNLTFTGLSMNPHSEKVIVYTVSVPGPGSELHEDIDQFLDTKNYMSVSTAKVSYSHAGYACKYVKNKAYADFLFSALIFADTDVNWKNFLNLEYQPFKVFMIMENKSRSPALGTTYTQYIPKDVPFYWSDNSIDIPILKTPGGKFVDVLRGSNDQNNPEYDMDSDGHPDVWLDTASIFPKGYTITEEAVYWANPWNHLRTGIDNFVFEDIDHDGVTAVDNNGDGIPETEDPGDKIRVWKITWDLGRVEGYQYHDPYSSYEIWVDPPDLVPLAAGVGYVHDSIPDPYPGMFYPYTQDINTADQSDTSWTHWMERDENGNVIWKQLIHQRINNYEGFTFIDTADAGYIPLPTDSVIGTCPQPHREFLAVLSLGGEEIDMTHYTPQESLYSKIDYETVFGEHKVTPIRTTYTYWAPLPNPMQFEYLSNNYLITDTLGEPLDALPEYGPAKLIFDMDASTEYTYYWIRNAGYDVDYNDPSQALDGIEGLGDGVFGYFVYSIPKGMGGYRISLPKNEDGTYNTNEIVSIDGQPFTKWIDNPNTLNEVQVWESPFEYQVYIPQVLIPPALDDDNGDETDDWIDDRGDRFHSGTGFLHDYFMPGDGEDYPNFPSTPFRDDIYGMVESGWYAGSDMTYGDDYFEIPGKTHIQIHADYTGKGREGSVEISKGGVLVVEEIFGGSPWVLFSHVLSGFASGTDVAVQSEVTPEIVYFGIDTVYLKHVIADTNEPHYFDGNFDPYHISAGFGETTITTYAGAKDPCSLISPAISMPAILDPQYDNHTITLIPDANAENPALNGYPKNTTGTFLEVRVEVNNSTGDNWINTTVTPQIPSELGNTSVELSYVAYPRPLVPSHYDAVSGNIIPGDQPGTFTTGWRFNQPENEVLINMGNQLNLMQPTRKAYFVFLFKIDPALSKGIYHIPFAISAQKRHYSGVNHGGISYDVPDALFCIAGKNANGLVSEFEKIVLDHTALQNLHVALTDNFKPTGRIKWSVTDFGREQFNAIPGNLSVSGNEIDLSKFSAFPSADTTQLVIMQEGTVDSYNSGADLVRLTDGQTLNFTHAGQEKSVISERLAVKPVGPRIRVKNTVYSINGVVVNDTIMYEPEADLYVKTLLTATNTGSDISSQTIIRINPGEFYEVVIDSLDENCSYSNGMLIVDMGDIAPGDMKEQLLPFILRPQELPEGIDIRTVIEQSDISYEGTLVNVSFNFTDTGKVTLDLYDFEATTISYDDLGNGQVQINATINNRGINASDVWLRIYPVIGGGTYEFPVAELRVENFSPLQSIDISGIYTLPVTDKSIDFIAIADDGYDYTEITEVNNTIEVNYRATGIEDMDHSSNSLQVFPVPFNDEVSFSYTLNGDYGNLQLKVYNMSGKLSMLISNCPANKGSNLVTWRNSSMPAGNYIYKLTGENMGHEVLLFSGMLVKTAL